VAGRTNGTTGAAGRANLGQARLNANQNAAFNRIGQTPFFTDPGARRQLNLNDNQFNTLNRAYQNAFTRYNQSLNGLNSSLTEQQRQAQMQQLATQFNTDLNRSVDTALTDPAMRLRFDQLNRQFMGFNAFNDPAIQGQLNLTPQQQEQLRLLAAQWQQQLGQFGNGTDVDPNQWNQMSSQYWEQLNAVLTPQQQQTWAQLVGQRFNFSPGVFFNSGELPSTATFGTLPTRRSSLNDGTTGTGNTTGNQGVVPAAATDQGITNPGNTPGNQGIVPAAGSNQGTTKSGTGNTPGNQGIVPAAGSNQGTTKSGSGNTPGNQGISPNSSRGTANSGNRGGGTTR
jgi:hypothetical protein